MAGVTRLVSLSRTFGAGNTSCRGLGRGQSPNKTTNQELVGKGQGTGAQGVQELTRQSGKMGSGRNQDETRKQGPGTKETRKQTGDQKLRTR